MKKGFLLFVIVAVFNLVAYAQKKAAKPSQRLNENSIVKDSSGMQYPYIIWQKLVSSGDYTIKTIYPHTDSIAFLLIKLDDEQKNKRYSRMPKPEQSTFFTRGQKLQSFSATDINGNKIKLNELAGKVVVLNFWFIGCPPCRMEIPELNKIAVRYAHDPGVVFVAIALDQKYDIKQYIKDNPFGYHIIDDGGMYAGMYKINLFPTNVVLDKEGKVLFHASGYTINTPYWIGKTIEEAKKTIL